MLKGAFITGLLLLGAITSCKKDSTNQEGIPNVSVYFYVNVDMGGYTPLLNSLGYVYTINDGYNNNGIILYCQSPGNYLAFDRSCPYDCQTNSKAVINVLTGNIEAKCPVCGTVYSLSTGAPLSGPSNMNLKQYYTDFSNPPNLVVSSSPF